ncbi:MAG: CDP-glucose 4,6-dehydratase [Desulfomonilaceae bacterium]
MTPSFWHNKKVLITGHTGFKGSWISLWLQSLGADVTGYALAPPTDPSLFDIANIEDHICSIIGDIRDLPKLQSVIAEKKPEIVIHMAAQAIVRRSYHDPVETFSSNVMGTVNVLEAIRLTDSIKVALIVTSDKCYENREWLWPYRENEPLGGHDPYSSSKACAEIVTAAYRKSFFSATNKNDRQILLATARAGNVIGGGDWAADRLVPDIIRAFHKAEPVIIRNPAAMRPWQHVLDPLNGYLTLIEKLWEGNAEFADAWNFGPDYYDAKSVSWIANKMVDLWGNGASWKTDDSVQPHEAHSLTLDSTKARTLLKWTPKYGVAEALTKTVEWYKTFYDGSDGRTLKKMTLDQIEEYSINGRISHGRTVGS